MNQNRSKIDWLSILYILGLFVLLLLPIGVITLLDKYDYSISDKLETLANGEKVEIDRDWDKYKKLSSVSTYLNEPILNAEIISDEIYYENVEIEDKYYDYIKISQYINKNNTIIPVQYRALENNPQSNFKMNIYYSYEEIKYSEDIIKVYPDNNEVIIIETAHQYRSDPIKTTLKFTLSNVNPIKINGNDNLNSLVENIGSDYFLVNNTLYTIKLISEYPYRSGKPYIMENLNIE